MHATSPLTSSQGSPPCLLPLQPQPRPLRSSLALASSTEGEGSHHQGVGGLSPRRSGVWERRLHQVAAPASVTFLLQSPVRVEIREVGDSARQEAGLTPTDADAAADDSPGLGVAVG